LEFERGIWIYLKELFNTTKKQKSRRLAKLPGFMDLDIQYNPFRFYEGVVPIPLPLLKEAPTIKRKSISLSSY